MAKLPKLPPYRQPGIVSEQEGATGLLPDVVKAQRVPSGSAELIHALSLLYPRHGLPESMLTSPITGAPSVIGAIIRNSQPVADRQTLTMAANRFPPMGTYEPPWFTQPPPLEHKPALGPGEVSGQLKPGSPMTRPLALSELLRTLLYPTGRRGSGIANSQAIGDRSPTTMTNPLPAYHPTTMSNTPLSHQIATMITQHLANQHAPLVNTPLAGAATQMGSALAARLKG